MKTHSILLSIATAFVLAATAAPYPVHAAGTVKIDFDKDAIKPIPVQDAAIRRAAADDIKEFNDSGKNAWAVAQADLNDDGRPDLLVAYADGAFCGSLGCSGAIVMATANGYAGNKIDLPNFVGRIDVLASKHRGMHDLRLPDAKDSYFLLKWDGKQYRSQ